MNISELSIRRPVLSTVLTLIILLFGFIGYNYLGVREYPSVDNPIISVSCSYPGANADVIENQITEPLEQNINGIPGIRSLSSVSQQGSSRITVEFELSVDLETAANDVRDKVSRAQRYLPRDCDPPTVSKADADATPILMVALQSDKRSLLELSEIADLTVKEQLQTISDVSSVSIWGEKRYSMRLWLDPIKMSGYGITPLDVKNAVDNENVELPSGSIEGNTTELTIRTLGLMHTAEEFNNLILKEDGNRIVRFSDIGRAELGPADIKSYMKMNGVPMVGVVVIPQPGANHIEIANAVYDRMEKMKKDLPEDVHYNYGFDNTKFIRASIDEVKQTVYEGLCTGYHHHFPLLARLACDACAMYCNPRFADWSFLRHVSGRFLHQCALHACRGACRGLGGGRRHRDDGEHLCPHRERDATERSRHRRSQGDFLCRHLHYHYAGGGILPYCIHGRYDRTTVPRIQYRGLRFGDYLLLRRIDFYADACHQTFNQKGTAELVLSQDRTFLRRDEPGIQPVTGRLPETALDCPALHHRHHPAYRSPLEYYPG